jgi:hypothetical protein
MSHCKGIERKLGLNTTLITNIHYNKYNFTLGNNKQFLISYFSSVLLTRAILP